MTPVRARAWYLARTPQGLPSADDFACRRVALAPPAAGEVLAEPEWLSVDPYMRTRMHPEGYGYLAKWRPGSPLSAWGVARVVESRGACRPERWLHARGMTGFTAWLAMRHYGWPRAGETVLVSAAAGAVGSLAVQWAHHAGARVIATAGSPAKRAWLRASLGVAAALDHHRGDMAAQLARAAPQGIDLNLEQLGGRVFEAAIEALKPDGRVVLCGLVSQYNQSRPRRAPPNLARLGGRLTSFVVPGHEARWAAFQRDMANQGSAFRAPLDIVEGFEAWPLALRGLFTPDKGIGKRCVRLSGA